MLRLRILWCALLVSSVLASTAFAQSDQSQLDEAARLTFESAREAFVAGDYETALQRFRQAYQLSPRPGLLYNIAQTLDRLRRDEETLEALREYLRAAPDAPNRAEVESRIRVLERALAERRQAEPPVPAPDEAGDGEPPAAERPQNPGIAILHPAFFIAGGALALGSGGVLLWSGLETIALNDAYLANDDPNTVADAFAAAESQQVLTNVFIGVTAGLGAIAVALAVFTDWNAFDGGSSAARLRPFFYAGTDRVVGGLGGSF
ncbi:MAG TPA: tetratricopeptide repeat protein [Sandaracinaceae bacterium]